MKIERFRQTWIKWTYISQNRQYLTLWTWYSKRLPLCKLISDLRRRDLCTYLIQQALIGHWSRDPNTGLRLADHWEPGGQTKHSKELSRRTSPLWGLLLNHFTQLKIGSYIKQDKVIWYWQAWVRNPKSELSPESLIPTNTPTSNF